jgi:hypothetical protein
MTTPIDTAHDARTVSEVADTLGLLALGLLLALVSCPGVVIVYVLAQVAP